MIEILDFFTVIGICTTIYFISKILDEHKINKLANETSRRLREERGREQFEAEWSNMTRGNTQAVFLPKIGRWVVFDKPNAP